MHHFAPDAPDHAANAALRGIISDLLQAIERHCANPDVQQATPVHVLNTLYLAGEQARADLVTPLIFPLDVELDALMAHGPTPKADTIAQVEQFARDVREMHMPNVCNKRVIVCINQYCQTRRTTCACWRIHLPLYVDVCGVCTCTDGIPQETTP